VPDSTSPFTRLIVGLIAVAVPAVVIGKAGIAVPIVPAAIVALIDPEWRRMARLPPAGAWTSLAWIAVATAVLWLPGVVHSLDPLRSFEAWGRTWIFVGAAAVLGRGVATMRDPSPSFLRIFVVAMIVAIALCYAGLVVPEILGLIHGRGWLPQSPETGVKQFASAATLMIPVAAWAAFRLRGHWRIAASLGVVASIGLLLLTSSRAAMAGVFAMLALVGCTVAWRHENRRWLAVACGTLLIAGIALLGWAHTLHQPDWQRRADTEVPVWMVDLPRQAMWVFTFEKAMESPWVGHGPNVVNYLPGASEPMPGMGSHTYISGHPHNWALEVLAETGVVGLAPLLGLVFLLFAAPIRAFLREGNPAALAALGVSAGYWVSGLFNFSFWSSWWQVSYLILFAFTYAVGCRPPVAGRDTT